MTCGMCKKPIGPEDEWYEVRRFKRTPGDVPAQTFGQEICVPCLELQDAYATQTRLRYGPVEFTKQSATVTI